MNASDRPHVTAERPLDGAWLPFTLPLMLKSIKADTWRANSRNAITLMKSRGLRIVLIAMHGATEIPTHRADGQLSLQVIEGSLRVSTDARVLTLEKKGICSPCTRRFRTPFRQSANRRSCSPCRQRRNIRRNSEAHRRLMEVI